MEVDADTYDVSIARDVAPAGQLIIALRYSPICSPLARVRRALSSGTTLLRSQITVRSRRMFANGHSQAMTSLDFKYETKGGSRRLFIPPAEPPRPTLHWDEVYNARTRRESY